MEPKTARERLPCTAPELAAEFFAREGLNEDRKD